MNTPTLSYMDGETISQLAARLDREIEAQYNSMDAESTETAREVVNRLVAVREALSTVIDHLNGEHADWQEARKPRQDPDREQFREGAI